MARRLEHLTLSKIVDVFYLAGIDGTPAFGFLAAPTGTGKTWATRSLAGVDFVQYMSHVQSPNEHRGAIILNSARTKYLICDDLGLAARWNQKEFFSTFCMVADGELSHTVYRMTQRAALNCSMLLVSTLDYYYNVRLDMISMGLQDRLIPIILDLSPETRREYQERLQVTGNIDRRPPSRTPELCSKGDVKMNILVKKDVNPRMLRNLQIISQYLTDEELEELIAVAHNPGRFSV